MDRYNYQNSNITESDTIIGIIDIGSNSVRLIIYDGLRRVPSVLFNEKILCGLGKGLMVTNKLNEEAIARTISTLKRFKAICQQIGVSSIFPVATAAVREAKNGSEFIENAQTILNNKINVISGEEEAEIMANGVISAIPSADGIIGDLGGGSLELINIKKQTFQERISLGLGTLYLMDKSNGSITKAKEIIDNEFSKNSLLKTANDRDLFAVGGSWRSIARFHIAETNYPLKIVHHYKISREEILQVTNEISSMDETNLKRVKAISKRRADTLPYGALVLNRILYHSNINNVIFSAYGVREGILFSKLSKEIQKQDPLFISCHDIAERRSRSVSHSEELISFSEQIFKNGDSVDSLKETNEQTRLRHAACLLNDVGWRAHSDYQAERSYSIISQAEFVGVDHYGRMFLALTVFFRYEGVFCKKLPKNYHLAISEQSIYKARVIAGIQRLSHSLTGTTPGLLTKIKLTINDRYLTLGIPNKYYDLIGEIVEKRLENLAILLSRKPQIEKIYKN